MKRRITTATAASTALALVLALGSAACHHASTSEPPKPDPANAAALTQAAAGGSLPDVPAPFPQTPVLPGTPDVATLVSKVNPSVVNITTEVQIARSEAESPFEFFFGPNGPGGGAVRPRGAPNGDRVLKRHAQGTGFIIDSTGHVLTNAHVVEGATQVKVKLADDREFKAHVKGRDPRLDVAVLELEGPNVNNLPAVSLGSSDQLRVGEYVVAIGNPFGLGHTVTMGIVSAKSRTIGAGPYDDFIQTDASINPGNSGGPLFNLHGQVIGINTAINPNGKGIGFAIPIDSVRSVVPQLLATGHVRRGRIGVGIQSIDTPLAKALGLDHPKGALVGEVEKNGPAEKAGIKSGDVILAVDQTEVPAAHDLPRIVASHAPGTNVTLKVMHDKQVHPVTVTLDTLKDEAPTDADDDDDGSVGQGVAPGGDRGAATRRAPAALGLQVEDAPNGVGALVRRVSPNGPADGELAPGDVVTEVNHQRVGSAADVERLVKSSGPTLMLKVERNGQARFVGIEKGRTP